MRVIIESAACIGNDTYSVMFSSESGCIRANWTGTAPQEGQAYDAELEIPDALVWGKNVFPSPGPDAITEKGGQVSITGKVCNLASDGVVALKLKDDIVLVEVAALPAIVPDWIEIHPPVIHLFDMNL